LLSGKSSDSPTAGGVEEKCPGKKERKSENMVFITVPRKVSIIQKRRRGQKKNKGYQRVILTLANVWGGLVSFSNTTVKGTEGKTPWKAHFLDTPRDRKSDYFRFSSQKEGGQSEGAKRENSAQD